MTGAFAAVAFGLGTAVWVGTPSRSPVGGIDPRVWFGDEPEMAAPGWAGAATEGIANPATALAVANAGTRPPTVNATTMTIVSGIRIRAPNNGDIGEDKPSSDGARRTCRQTTDSPTDRPGQISATAHWADPNEIEIQVKCPLRGPS